MSRLNARPECRFKFLVQYIAPQGIRLLLTESRKHSATQLLCEIPRLGPIRVALLIALLQTPYRFRTKRQLWAYCGLALQTRIRGEYRFSGNQLQRCKRSPALRGLNVSHNHDLKSLFKSAAAQVIAAGDPLGAVDHELGAWPVVNEDGFRGMVTVEQLKEAIRTGQGESTVEHLIANTAPSDTFLEGSLPPVRTIR